MAASIGYSKNVFINCPFDGPYKPMFEAIVFAVFDCGFLPRCALETDDSGQVRIDKIFNIIASCKFGINDLSRAELDPATGLPRFNMPLWLDRRAPIEKRYFRVAIFGSSRIQPTWSIIWPLCHRSAFRFPLDVRASAVQAL